MLLPYDHWISNQISESCVTSCLMPNGIFISLTISVDSTIQDLKEVSFAFMGAVDCEVFKRVLQHFRIYGKQQSVCPFLVI